MTASQPQRHVGKSEQVCHDLFSGVMLCAVEYMYLIFMKVMIGCALLVVTIGWSVNFYYFTNSTKPDHLTLVKILQRSLKIFKDPHEDL